MKIIGANGNTLILEAEKREVAKIAGFGYESEEKCPSMSPGATINVSDIYNQWDSLISNKRNLAEIKKNCELILDSVRKIQPITDAAVSI